MNIKINLLTIDDLLLENIVEDFFQLIVLNLNIKRMIILLNINLNQMKIIFHFILEKKSSILEKVI